jgi:diguanylate cyclase (GGDEF)-like protein
MQLLNNRYRVLREFSNQSYLVRDLKDYKQKVVRIIESEYITPALISLFSREYTRYNHIASANIAKSLDFGLVKKVDGKRDTLTRYFMVSEFTGGNAPDAVLLGALSEANVLRLFSDACRAVAYLHAKNIIHGDICPENTWVIRNSAEYSLKLKDLASVELWRANGGENLYVCSPERVAGEGKTVASDIYALGVFLFLLEFGTEDTGKDFRADFEAWKEYDANKEGSFGHTLSQIIDKMVCSPTDRFASVAELIAALNKAFNQSFAALVPDELNIINNHVPLIGREAEAQAVSAAFDKKIANSPEAHFIHLHGAQGVGKTALLRDLNYRLYLRNMSVYAAFDCEGDAAVKTILRGLLEDLPDNTHDQSDIIEQISSFSNGKTQALTQNIILKFIYDCIKDKPVVFIIDALDKANAETVDTLQKLVSVNKKLLVVYSTRTGCKNTPKGETSEITLTPFSQAETVDFIRQKLNLQIPPVLFAKEVFTASGGNPLFIEEILKSLHMNGILFINEKGAWDTTYKIEEYGSIPMPQSIREAAEHQAARFSDAQKHLLTALAVFTSPVPVYAIAACADTDEGKTAKMLKQFRETGLVQENNFFVNRMLGNYLYKPGLHAKAADALIARGDTDSQRPLYDEIIYQLEKAGGREAQLYEYYTANATKLREMAEYEKAVQCMEKAVEIAGDKRASAYMNLAKIYSAYGNAGKIKECHRQACDALITNTDTVEKLTVLCGCLDNVETAFSTAKALFDENPELKTTRQDIYYNLLFYEASDGEKDLAKRIVLLEALYNGLADDDYNKKAGLLRSWGFTLYMAGKPREASDKWKEAEPFLDSITDLRARASMYNNIGGVAQVLGDFDTARRVLTDGIAFCKNHGILVSQSNMLGSLMGCTIKAAEFDKALPIALEMVRLDEITGKNTSQHLFQPYLYADKYTDACELTPYTDSVLDKIGQMGGGVDPTARAHYLSHRARLCIYLGDDETARIFLDKEIAECEGKNFPTYLKSIFEPYCEAVVALESSDPSPVPAAFAKLKTILEPEKTRQDNLNYICEFLLLVRAHGGIKALGTAFDEELAWLGGLPLAPVVQAKYSILKGGLDALTDGREKAKTHSQPLTHAIISAELGKYYEKTNPYYSLYYYAEASQTTQRLLEDVPAQYRRAFVNRHQLHDREYENIWETPNLRESARAIHFARLPEGIFSIDTLAANMHGDFAQNLNLAACYIAAVTFTTRCEIVADDADEEFILLAVNNKDKSDFTLDFPVLRRVKALENDYVSDSKICFPVKHSRRVAGYVYLYTDSILHNFTEEALDHCKKLNNLLAVNIDQQTIKIASSIDKLTGALNRKAFDAVFDRHLERSAETGERFSIILSDLDNFKSVNDTYGHQTGDDVLRGAGRVILANTTTKNEHFGRYGGEEFIILLDGAGTEEALAAAEKLRTALDDAKLLGSKRSVTASLGIATFGVHDTTKAGLIEKADRALYVCKENGRNQSRVYDPAHTGKAKSKNYSGSIITGDAIRDGARMRAILDIIELIAHKLTPEEKLRIMLSKTIEITRSQQGAYLAIDNNEITRVYTSAKSRLTPDSKLADTVIETKMPLSGYAKGTHSLYVPVFKNGTVTGIFCFENTQEAYGTADVDIIGYLSPLSGVM